LQCVYTCIHNFNLCLFDNATTTASQQSVLNCQVTAFAGLVSIFYCFEQHLKLPWADLNCEFGWP